MEIKCNYCNGNFPDTLENCPHCGAANENIKRSADHTPKTIAELQQWYKDRNLPPYEVTRFFIGQNYTEKKAFGIYEENGKFIVYKNKDTGERAIRYEGPDEAYAVNELYLKLKSEILNQKAHQSGNAPVPKNKKKTAKEVATSIGIIAAAFAGFVTCVLVDGLFQALMIAAVAIIILAVVFAFIKSDKKPKHKWPIYIGVFVVVFTIAFIPLRKYYHTVYYQYDDSVYCYYHGDYYAYDDSYNDYYPISYNSLPVGMTSNMADYEYNWTEDSWESNTYDFTTSGYYADNFASSSSDSDYDWDSGDSWDSGGTDWGSDW